MKQILHTLLILLSFSILGCLVEVAEEPVDENVSTSEIPIIAADSVAADSIAADSVAADSVAADSIDTNTGFCTKELNPVCGRNGETYSNSCEAQAAGINDYFIGACDIPDHIDSIELAGCPRIKAIAPVCLQSLNLVTLTDKNGCITGYQCESESTYEEELEGLRQMFSKIQDLAAKQPCVDPSEWAFISYGSQACGGPQGYIAYHTLTDNQDLMDIIQAHKRAEDQFNRKWRVMSTCMIAPEPQGISCKNKAAVFIQPRSI